MRSGHRRQRATSHADPTTRVLEPDAVFEPGSGAVPVRRTPPIRVWRRPATGWDRAFAAVFAAVLLGFSALFLSMGRQDAAATARLREHGVQTTATLTDITLGKYAAVTVAFTTRTGAPVRVRLSAPDGVLVPGAQVPVVYVPDTLGAPGRDGVLDEPGDVVIGQKDAVSSGAPVDVALGAPVAFLGLVQLVRLVTPRRRPPAPRGQPTVEQDHGPCSA